MPSVNGVVMRHLSGAVGLSVNGQWTLSGSVHLYRNEAPPSAWGFGSHNASHAAQRQVRENVVKELAPWLRQHPHFIDEGRRRALERIMAHDEARIGKARKLIESLESHRGRVQELHDAL